MPFVSIDTHSGATTADDRRAISDAIHASMREVLGIPDDDRFHFFSEHSESHIFHDGVVFGKPRNERMIFVTLSFNQRTPEQKNALYESLIAHLGATAQWGPDEVMFRIIETASENWWASGRVVNPDSGYDERMTGAGAPQAGT